MSNLVNRRRLLAALSLLWPLRALAALSISAPASNPVYISARNSYTLAQGHATQLQAAILANSILSSLVLNLLNDMVVLAAFATEVTGNATLTNAILEEWAADSPGSPTPAAVGTALGVMSAASATLAIAIVADLPVDGQGHLLDRTLVNNVPTPVTWTASVFTHTPGPLAAWLAAEV